jgi:beta-lactamase regulating signal transducer with metallopeptidase domain
MIELWSAWGPKLWVTSWQAAVLALVVAAVLAAAGRRIAPAWRHAFWLVPLVRLWLVEVPPHPWSLFAWINPPPAEAVAQAWVGWEAAPVEPRKAEALAAAAPWSPGSVAAGLWLAGAVLTAGGLGALEWRGRRRLARLPLLEDERVAQLVREGAERLGLGRVPELRAAPLDLPAGVAGGLRPVLLISPTVATLPEARLRHVLWHELAHLRRGDLWVLAAARAACVLHWFNPAAWWLARRLRAYPDHSRDPRWRSKSRSARREEGA